MTTALLAYLAAGMVVAFGVDRLLCDSEVDGWVTRGERALYAVRVALSWPTYVAEEMIFLLRREG